MFEKLWIEGHLWPARKKTRPPRGPIIEEPTEQKTAASIYLGPSISQVSDVLETEEYHEDVCGTAMQSNDECRFSKESGEVCETIEDALKLSVNKAVMPWPYVSPDPVSEYDEDANLFPKAFPWLRNW